MGIVEVSNAYEGIYKIKKQTQLLARFENSFTRSQYGMSLVKLFNL